MSIIKSPHPDVAIPEDVSLVDHVTKDFDTFGDQVALVDGPTGRSYTFAQLKKLIRVCGSALTRLGFKQHDVFAIYSPNLPEFAIIFFGVIGIGGTVTTVNPLYTADELAHQLEMSGASYVITIGMFADKAKQAKDKCEKVKDVYVFGEAEGCTPFSSLLRDDGSAFPADVRVNPREDVAVLPYSSGTTGLPKGVMLTHYNLIANLEQMRQDESVESVENPCLLGLLPFFHIYGMSVILAASLQLGAKVVVIPKFDQELFLKCIQDHKVTHVHLVPPIALFLAKHPMVDKYDFSHVQELFCGAAPMGKELSDAVRSRLKVPSIRQGFGMTETSPVTHMVRLGESKPGSVGVPLGHTEMKVVDIESGKLLGEGEDGELCVRGPQVMKGYLNNPEATANTIKDGWLHTGDIGHYDSEYNFYVVDRLKELIKYKGYQVPPAELEALLLSEPRVQDAAVIGVPDLEAGELPKAYVVKKADSDVTEEDIKQFIAGKVAPYKKLRFVEFTDQIPKSASGKILRRVLKAKEVERQKND
ncbi:PREDICTED: 4-coumarate--CoA ligase 1-like isoform X2 [Branchiostoma belcheri]|uniref:Luciferin 4-monooxygenase n=1 Tax=Branchiostoma belcheri TaxID=7741 RepID=A0A6P4Y9V2_BRABE|nr:PREDICTED: 4-coumarate--CoA ligase 1-like isoform X1 [Branchiostoma belcheri]XP_019625816.1 PREDICTED: 4-coumarate--CoA ligase 1-like isoform X2 [Branchiostoma belcheri]